MKIILIFFLSLIFFINLYPPKLTGEGEQIFTTKNDVIKIPRISLDGDICVFERDFCLNSGVWMKYFDYEGNVLLTGHSFTILPFRAGVFYALSDLEVGDLIYISLEEERVYVVEEIFVTDRDDLDVENFEKLKNTLVLYSCFPLWSASERIVVRAGLCDLCEYEL